MEIAQYNGGNIDKAIDRFIRVKGLYKIKPPKSKSLSIGLSRKKKRSYGSKLETKKIKQESKKVKVLVPFGYEKPVLALQKPEAKLADDPKGNELWLKKLGLHRESASIGAEIFDLERAHQVITK